MDGQAVEWMLEYAMKHSLDMVVTALEQSVSGEDGGLGSVVSERVARQYGVYALFRLIGHQEYTESLAVFKDTVPDGWDREAGSPYADFVDLLGVLAVLNLVAPPRNSVAAAKKLAKKLLPGRSKASLRKSILAAVAAPPGSEARDSLLAQYNPDEVLVPALQVYLEPLSLAASLAESEDGMVFLERAAVGVASGAIDLFSDRAGGEGEVEGEEGEEGEVKKAGKGSKTSKKGSKKAGKGNKKVAEEEDGEDGEDGDGEEEGSSGDGLVLSINELQDMVGKKEVFDSIIGAEARGMNLASSDEDESSAFEAEDGPGSDDPTQAPGHAQLGSESNSSSSSSLSPPSSTSSSSPSSPSQPQMRPRSSRSSARKAIQKLDLMSTALNDKIVDPLDEILGISPSQRRSKRSKDRKAAIAVRRAIEEAEDIELFSSSSSSPRPARKRPASAKKNKLITRGKRKRGKVISFTDDDDDDEGGSGSGSGGGIVLPSVKSRKVTISGSPTQPKRKKAKRGGGRRGSTTTITSRPKQRRKWTDEEIEHLTEGVEKYGKGNWAVILSAYSFNNRTNINLKDKWRTLEKQAKR